MGYSSRKPYNSWKGPANFFRKPTRYLRESNALESSFEKPYQTKVYTEMHQAPNTPTNPNDPGSGELTISFAEGYCNYGIQAYAGGDYQTVGGPQESSSGWQEPKLLEGEIISWKVSGPDNRRLSIVVTVGAVRHIVEITFVDGWGRKYSRTVTLICATNEPFSFLAGDVDALLGIKLNTVGAYAVGLNSESPNRLYVCSSVSPYVNWTSEDTGQDFNVLDSAIALDSSGNPFVIGIYSTIPVGNKVAYVNKSGGSWQTVYLGDAPSTSIYIPDIAVDSSGYIHAVVCIKEVGSEEVRYYTNKSGSWTEEVICTVEAASDRPYYCTLCEDSGTVYIAYLYYDDSASTIELRCSYGSSGSWTEEVIDTKAAGTYYSVLGKIRVIGGEIKLSYSYYEASVSSVIEAITRNGVADWSAETVDSGELYVVEYYGCMDYFYTTEGEELILAYCSPDFSNAEYYCFSGSGGTWTSSILPYSGYGPAFGLILGFNPINAAMNTKDELLATGSSYAPSFGYRLLFKEF